MWILINWLHQKPADLDLHYFHKRVYSLVVGGGGGGWGGGGEGCGVLFLFWVSILLLF